MQQNQQHKSKIRQVIRDQRKSLSSLEISLAGKLLLKNLLKSHWLHTNQKVACFLSFDSEISTQSIIKEIPKFNSDCFLPKLKPYKPNRLWFMPYQIQSRMEDNRYGIPEVDLPVNRAIAVSDLDLVLLPLVAFDKIGNRLGMGGGFYDATFAHLRNKKKRPKFIGLAFELQKVESLPSDSWDLPLDGVCTESSFYSFSR